MVLRPTNGLSLCAGAGGLDLGLMLAEPGFHTRCFVEWEEYPRQALIAGQRGGYFAPAPIWTDLRTFDARPFRGAIDTVLAGYPCQPFSAAGQRKGADDPRHLWPHVARVIGECRPVWVFLENVGGHVSLGLDTVLRDLWGMGYTPAAGLFTAAETGAPHERERVFIVAYCPDNGRQERDARQDGLPEPDCFGGDMAHPDGGHPGAEREQRGGELGFQPEGGGTCAGHMDDPAHGGGGIHARRWSEGRGAADAGGAGVRDVVHAQRAERRQDATEGHERHGDHPGRDQAAGRAGKPDAPLDHAPSPRRDHARSGADTDSEGRERLSGAGRDDLADTSGASGHAGRAGDSGGGDRPGASRASAGLGGSRPTLFPPGPGDADAWSDILRMAPDLAPALSLGDVKRLADHCAQMVARGELAEAQAQSRVCLAAHGLAHRARALRLLGNGVSPIQAAYAWRTLTAAHGLQPIELEDDA